jgi:SNF2 family DNA or RNA helicase
MLLLKREPRLDARHQAFLYQVQAVEAVRSLEYAALFHEQGLGKTKIGIDLALSWLKEKVVDSVIVVTKRALVKNWTDEIKAHTFLEARVFGQDKNANFFAFNSPARLYLTHYEVLRSEQRRFVLFQKTRKIGVILDEAHKIKNPDAELTKAFHELADGFVRRVIMTGTPVANRPYDIWAQIKFLDGGESLGDSFSEFREHLDLSNELADSPKAQTAFEDSLGSVFAKIQPFTVRETKGTAGIELPEKHIENVPVRLEEAQLALYEHFRTELGAEVLRGGELITDDAEEILKRLLRLVQVASNPLLVDESYKGEPGKLPVTRELVGRALADNSKVILWTNFIANADWLGKQFRDSGSVVVHGNKRISDRNAALDAFKTDPDIKVLIATPASAKEGLTLTVANHAVFFDRSFSLDDYLQAQDRIHRISQKKDCHVWNLVAEGTVDDWVDMLLAAKHLAAQLAQGDIDSEEYRRQANYDFGRVVREILRAGDDHGIA